MPLPAAPPTPAAARPFRGARPAALPAALAVAALAGAVVPRAPARAETLPPAADVAAEVDLLLAAAWREAGVEPAPPTDDVAWLRRLALDVDGVIPEPATVAAAAARDLGPARRAALVRGFLHGQGHARLMGLRWARLLLGPAEARDGLDDPDSLTTWLATQVAANAPWDGVVRALLAPPEAAPAAMGGPPTARGPAQDPRRRWPMIEDLTGNAMAVFHALQVRCAQCHDHPWHEDLTQATFWGLAGLFSPGPVRPPRADGGRGPVAAPRWLDGRGADAPAGRARLEVAAALATAPDDPRFARATVNRVWSFYLGAGFFDPDDVRTAARLEGVLARLERDFVASGFDLRRLCEVILTARAYGLAATGPEQGRLAQERAFARGRVRALLPEQLWRSIVRARGLEGRPPDELAGLSRGFFRLFDAQGASSSYSIAQALLLLNGAPTRGSAPELARALEGLAPDDQLRAVYLRVLSRPPERGELSALRRLLAGGSDARLAVLEDLTWALLNSTEFSTTH